MENFKYGDKIKYGLAYGEVIGFDENDGGWYLISGEDLNGFKGYGHHELAWGHYEKNKMQKRARIHDLKLIDNGIFTIC